MLSWRLNQAHLRHDAAVSILGDKATPPWLIFAIVLILTYLKIDLDSDHSQVIEKPTKSPLENRQYCIYTGDRK